MKADHREEKQKKETGERKQKEKKVNQEETKTRQQRN